MPLDRRASERMLKHCGVIRDDDGIDPREYFKPRLTQRGNDRKARQLCRQVAHTIDQVLAGEMDDEILGDLGVTSVVPAPNSGRLLVMLELRTSAADFDFAAAARKLAACEGRLRCAVAAAITRRKTPQLIFSVRGPISH
jgi:hypothetical protein